MRTLTTAVVILVVAGVALVVAGRAVGRRRGERPTGPRFASIVAGALLIASAVMVLLYTFADRD